MYPDHVPDIAIGLIQAGLIQHSQGVGIEGIVPVCLEQAYHRLYVWTLWWLVWTDDEVPLHEDIRDEVTRAEHPWCGQGLQILSDKTMMPGYGPTLHS